MFNTLGPCHITALGSDGNIHVECLAVASTLKSWKILDCLVTLISLSQTLAPIPHTQHP
jgi:hypothetical protein